LLLNSNFGDQKTKQFTCSKFIINTQQKLTTTSAFMKSVCVAGRNGNVLAMSFQKRKTHGSLKATQGQK